MNRKQLAARVAQLNAILDRPAVPSTTIDGKYASNVGHIFMDYYTPGPDNPYAYQICEYGNTAGGERTWTNYRMKRAEFEQYLTGLFTGLHLAGKV